MEQNDFVTKLAALESIEISGIYAARIYADLMNSTLFSALPLHLQAEAGMMLGQGRIYKDGQGIYRVRNDE